MAETATCNKVSVGKLLLVSYGSWDVTTCKQACAGNMPYFARQILTLSILIKAFSRLGFQVQSVFLDSMKTNEGLIPCILCLFMSYHVFSSWRFEMCLAICPLSVGAAECSTSSAQCSANCAQCSREVKAQQQRPVSQFAGAVGQRCVGFAGSPYLTLIVFLCTWHEIIRRYTKYQLVNETLTRIRAREALHS